MKFIKKIPSTDKELSSKLVLDGWNKIKEPSNFSMTMLLSLPFAFLGGGAVILITYWLSPSLYSFINNEHGFEFTIRIDYILLFIVAMLLHEFIHAAFIPNVLNYNKTFWGINGAFGFVYTLEEIRKGRFLVISIMPFLTLSIFLPILLAILGLLKSYIVILCLINAMGSCVDFLNICLIAFQVPNGAYIKNNGVETFYK